MLIIVIPKIAASDVKGGAIASVAGSAVVVAAVFKVAIRNT